MRTSNQAGVAECGARRGRTRVCAAVLGALVLGVASVGLVSKVTDLSLRQLGGHAAAEGSAVSLPREPGDPRIVWLALPTSLASPVVADGDTAWLAVAERLDDTGRFESHLYQFIPGTMELRQVAKFGGRPTALAVGPKDIAIGVGADVLLVTRGGTVRSVTALADGSGSYVSALAFLGDRLYGASSVSATIFELDLVNAAVMARIDVGSEIPPPVTLISFDERTLIASTPFGQVGGLGPGSVVIDTVSRTVTRADLGKPFSFVSDGAGSLLATQAIPGGGVTAIGRDGGGMRRAATNAGAAIPWDGRWDVVAVGSDLSLWAAIRSAGMVFRQGPDGSLDTFKLPSMHIIASVPYGASAPADEDEARRLSVAARTVDSMAALADGSLVFVSQSPGGALGYIPGR